MFRPFLSFQSSIASPVSKKVKIIKTIVMHLCSLFLLLRECKATMLCASSRHSLSSQLMVVHFEVIPFYPSGQAREKPIVWS